MAWTEFDSAVTSPAESPLTFAQMTAEVILNCGNMPTQHPHYSKVGEYINLAKDELQSMLLAPSLRRHAFDLMPRLKDWRWSDSTVNAQQYLSFPANILWLDSVTYTQSTSAYDPSTQQEYPSVEVPDANTFAFFSKTQTGWPVMWRRAGSRIEFWPTPSSSPTNYLTKVILRGARAEDDLTGTQTFKMPPRLVEFVVDLATAITMKRAHMTGADDLRTSTEDKLTKFLGIKGQESIRDRLTLRVAGAPR